MDWYFLKFPRLSSNVPTQRLNILHPNLSLDIHLTAVNIFGIVTVVVYDFGLPQSAFYACLCPLYYFYISYQGSGTTTQIILRKHFKSRKETPSYLYFHCVIARARQYLSKRGCAVWKQQQWKYFRKTVQLLEPLMTSTCNKEILFKMLHRWF